MRTFSSVIAAIVLCTSSSLAYAQDDFPSGIEVRDNPNASDAYRQILVATSGFASYQALSLLVGLEEGTIVVGRYERSCPDLSEMILESPGRNELEVHFIRKDGLVCYDISGTAPLRGHLVAAKARMLEKKYMRVPVSERAVTALEQQLEETFKVLNERSSPAFLQ